MGKSAKPRKKYRPKPAVNPLLLVASNNSPLTSTEVQGILLALHSAMHDMVHGKATRDSWEVISGSLNMAVVISEMVYDNQYRAEIEKAMDAHMSARNRFRAIGRLGYSGPELQAVNSAIEIHEAQLDSVNFKELTTAEHSVRQRLKEKYFGRFAKAAESGAKVPSTCETVRT